MKLTRPKRGPQLLWLLVLLPYLSGSAPPALAKEILEGVESSENRVYIRTDGLACYFCAYGLERFFKKTGRIAAFDLDMQEGIVEVVFVQDKPLIASKTLSRFVHDAGFAPRWIDAELVGRLEITSTGDTVLRVRETGERVLLEDNDTLRGYRSNERPKERKNERQEPAVVRVRGRAQDDENSAMRLAPEWIRREAPS
ncbi:MAG: hypothetical protein IH936_15110 [Acidobacteria bacterium]|nr:hypothetical protein [Acidobacteriota bacterium]